MSDILAKHKEIVPKLSACRLFRGFSAQEFPAVLQKLCAKEKTIQKGVFFFREGEPALYVGILLSGEAQIVRDDYYGNRSVLSDLQPGDIFGEVFACANIRDLPVSVMALKESTALFLNCRGLWETEKGAVDIQTRLIRNLLMITAQKNLLLNQKIELLSKKTTREKLTAFLIMKAKENGSEKFRISYDRQQLADYLGVERSAMSAELSRMRREGLIDFQKSEFCVRFSDKAFSEHEFSPQKR